MHGPIALLAAAASLLLSGVAAQSSTGLQESGFVRAVGTNFADQQCDQFVFSGYNTWEAVEQAYGQDGGLSGLNSQFQAAVANDLTVIRGFAFAVQSGLNLQTSAGQYDQGVLVALDNVIASAGAAGLKLILAIANNWNYNAGLAGDTKGWYAQQAGSSNIDDFWTLPAAIQLYKNHVSFLMSRVNSVTGVAYGNDPTIFSWDLINEGRCETSGCTAANIQSWTASVAPFVKGLTNSMVTIGQEGFFQASNCQANYANPVPNSDGWPLATGQDFLPNHQVSGIDYASIHMWADNWDRPDIPFAEGWMESHIQDTSLLGKPLVLEEFGKADMPFQSAGNTYGTGTTAADQTAYYKLAYTYAENSIDNGGVLRGIAFWRWDGINSEGSLSDTDQALTLSSSSSAFTQVVQPFSQRVKNLSLGSTKVPGCTPGGPPATPATVLPPSAGTPQAGTAVAPSTPISSIAAVSTAGRKLLQSGGINSQVTNCTAFAAYSLNAGR